MPVQITKKDLEEQIEENQTILRTDVEMENVEGDGDIKPPMTELLDLTIEQEERLKKEVFDFVPSMQQERKDIDGEISSLESQYGGEIIPEKFIEFNLNVPVTQMKCDAVERLAVRAFLKSDPKFSVSLRPESVRKGMTTDQIRNIERDQSDYLDYALDERIVIESPLRKTIHQAVTLKGGWLKVPYCYTRKRKIREEFYSGKRTDSGTVGEDGQPIIIADGMKGFLQNYPKAVLPGDIGHKYFKQLVEFKDVRFRSKYWAITYDDPKPIYVNTKNFWARKSTEGYEGLCNEQIYFERIPYTFWEMKKMEKRDEMVNVDKMEFSAEGMKDGDKIVNYQIKEHNVLEITYHFKMDKDNDEETRIICRFGEDNKQYLGAFEYPYDFVECVYVPFYIFDKESGLYKSGLAERLTQNNQTQNAMLNMMLTEAWLELVSTPITRDGSSITDQLLSKNFKPGVPLTVGATENIKEEIGFLEKSQKAIGAQMIPILQYISKLADDSSGVNDAQATGTVDPQDKRAPAAKTAMLLRQSGINIEEYIDVLLPSFNKVGEIMMKLTYQMSQSGRKFRPKQRAERITGNEDIFSEISRDDMILETVIQSQAGAFAFDKIEEINKNSLVWQTFRADPTVSRDPSAIREMARGLMESVSPKWKAKVNKILLSDVEFNQKIMGVGIQALDMYIKSIKQQSEATGVAPEPQIQEFLKIVAQLMAQVSTPTENEAKAIK